MELENLKMVSKILKELNKEFKKDNDEAMPHGTIITVDTDEKLNMEKTNGKKN